MTHSTTKHNEVQNALELIAEQGFERLPDAVAVLINEAMRLERSRHLGAEPWERSDERRGYANGYKPKTLQSRMGTLNLRVPQTRDGEFYPCALERGQRSERALKLAVAQMYVEGVSTRKVAAITEKLCGFGVTSAQVSRCAAELDAELSAWRERPLETPYPYLIVDARYEKVRLDNKLLDCAVLLTLGVRADGKRELLGCSVALSEAEVHWRDFFASLVKRGLHGVQMIGADDHQGLAAARKAVFPAVPWQRCQTHLQRNAIAYIPRQNQRRPVAAELRAIFNAPDAHEAQRLLDRFVDQWQEKAPKLAAWAAEAIPEGFAVFQLPEPHRRRLRTTNSIERVNREIKRRTRVASIFPNEASCLRLVTAVAMEQSEEWLTGRNYLNMDVDTDA